MDRYRADAFSRAWLIAGMLYDEYERMLGFSSSTLKEAERKACEVGISMYRIRQQYGREIELNDIKEAVEWGKGCNMLSYSPQGRVVMTKQLLDWIRASPDQLKQMLSYVRLQMISRRRHLI